MADPQPGEVIIPIDRSESTQPPQVAASPVVANVEALPSPPPNPVSTHAPTSQHLASPISVPQVPPAQLPSSGPDTQPSYTAPDSYSPSADTPLRDGIAWRSAEFMAHDKDTSWYVATTLGSAVIAGVVYLLNRDVTTAAIILFALIGLAYFSGRKPREQDFVVTADGVQIGRNYYPFHNFRSFSVAEDPAATSIILTPLKRFMPAVNIYVPSEYEDQVVNFIAGILPFEQHKTDFVENLMRRIHF